MTVEPAVPPICKLDANCTLLATIVDFTFGAREFAHLLSEANVE